MSPLGWLSVVVCFDENQQLRSPVLHVRRTLLQLEQSKPSGRHRQTTNAITPFLLRPAHYSLENGQKPTVTQPILRIFLQLTNSYFMTWVYSGILLKSLTSEWLHSICCTQNYRKANKTDITDMNSTKTYTPKIFYNSQTIFRAEEK